MSELLALWLPILVCSIILQIASTLAWIVSPHHKPDYVRHPEEDQLMELIRSSKAPVGQQYMFPFAEHSELKDEAVIARYKAGPWGLLNVWPCQPKMGKNIFLTFVFFLVTTFFLTVQTEIIFLLTVHSSSKSEVNVYARR